MNDIERDIVFSDSVKAGRRIYYFDVKQSRHGERYVSITESKKIVDGPEDRPTFTFEKHKLFLYKEDYEKFLTALMRTIEFAKNGDSSAPVVDVDKSDETVADSAESGPLDVELDF